MSRSLCADLWRMADGGVQSSADLSQPVYIPPAEGPGKAYRHDRSTGAMARPGEKVPHGRVKSQEDLPLELLQ